MPIYRAPIDDFRFVLHELLEVEKHRDLPYYGELSADLIDDILTNAARFCEIRQVPVPFDLEQFMQHEAEIIDRGAVDGHGRSFFLTLASRTLI